ncbi:MAG: hypothetical protein Q9169_001186 [Polycauliona sp. 2 TL-2023]
MFGVSCIPFKANWRAVPDAKCFSKDLLAVTNQINASLACACDIATALIPQFLLWGVQMRPRTRRQLNVIFGLGLITASLSIGRAATLTRKALRNIVPSYYFTLFEDKLGIIIACAPALRQFWAYRSRTRTCLPTKQRQYPNEDFEKMRYRINLRDILWYRKARIVGNRVFDAAPIFQGRSPPPEASSDDPQSSSKVKNSVLDSWENKMKEAFAYGPNQKTAQRPPSIDSKPTSSEFSGRKSHTNRSGQGAVPLKRLPSARKWGVFPRGHESSIGRSPRETFLLSNSEAGTSAAMTTRDDQDGDLSDELFNVKSKPTSGSQIV